MKHTLLISLCFLSYLTQLNGMDNSVKPINKDGIFFQLIPLPKIFDESIPSEIQKKILDKLIFNSSNQTLQKASQDLHKLSLVCKPINIALNENTLVLIKQLSQAFNYSNERVAKSLHTKTASEILFKQLAFATMCGNHRYAKISCSDALHIKKNNIDLNFTYEDRAETQLIIALTVPFTKSDTTSVIKPHIIQWLIDNGADINITDLKGVSAVLRAVYDFSNNEKQLIEYFWDHPQFNINQIYTLTNHIISPHLGEAVYKKTTLLLELIRSSCPETRYKQKIELIKQLCARGADPELAGDNLTPLNIAEYSDDQELMTIFYNTTATKHAN